MNELPKFDSTLELFSLGGEPEKLPVPIKSNRHPVGLPPDGTTPAVFTGIVNGAYQCAINGSLFPSVDEVYNITAKKYSRRKISEVMGSKEYLEAIKQRGMLTRPDDANGITAQQSYLLSILSDPTFVKRSMRDKLKAAGVTYPQYRAWLKQPVFLRHFNRMTEGMLTDHTGNLHTVLMNKALNGDLAAIKYIYELNGRFDPASRQMQDIAVIVERIIDIIVRNVTDPQTLQRISTEMQLIINPAPAKTIRGELGA